MAVATTCWPDGGRPGGGSRRTQDAIQAVIADDAFDAHRPSQVAAAEAGMMTAEEVRAWIAERQRRLNRVYETVDGCSSHSSPEARNAMLQRLPSPESR